MIKGFTLYIKDVLKRSTFQKAKLIAGNRGLDREVGWVHVIEITQIAPFVSKNDFILTTGLWLNQVEEEQLAYMEQLIHQEAAGLCIEFGTAIERIPDKIIDLANAHDFPLIVFEHPVRFVAITQDIHGLLINQQHQILKDLEAFSRKLQQMTLQSTDVHAVLHLLYEYTNQQIVYHSTVESNKFVPSLPSEMTNEMSAFYKRQVENDEGAAQETAFFRMNDDQTLLSQPVICLGQTLSYVGIVLPNNNSTETLILLLDYTAKSIATLLIRSLFLEEKMMRDQNQLVQDIMDHKIEDEEVARTRMGLRPKGHGEKDFFMGGIIEMKHEMWQLSQERIHIDHQDILVLLRALLKKHGIHHLLMMKDTRIYVICAKDVTSGDPADLLRKGIAKVVEQLRASSMSTSNSLTLVAGFGKIRSVIADMYLDFKEAIQVIEMARIRPTTQISLFYENLGIYQLLKAIPDQSFLRAFVRDHLGALIAYDQEHHLQLIQTLEVYLKCMGSKKDTAEQLYIHRQTLYNRLDKMTEILGDHFLDSDKRTCLEMALLVHGMLTGESPRTLGQERTQQSEHLDI